MRSAIARPLFAVVATAAACDASLTSVGAWRAEPGLAAANDASVSLYMEAENGQLSDGFVLASDPKASGGLYLAPPASSASDSTPGPARASYTFDLPSGGTYFLWGRIHSPDASHNRFWFQIDGGEWKLWRISTGEVWWWNQAHDDAEYAPPLTFALAAGTHTLVIADAVSAMGIDRFYFTTTSETPPGNEGPCNPPHSIQIGGACVPSCGSLGGNECGVVRCAGYPALPAYDCDICCVVPNDP